MKKVVIIGGGASGIMTAIWASRCGGDVVLIEHMDRIGKKLLSTGNGKCNYTNRKQGLSYYRGEDPAFVLPALSKFGLDDTITFFRELGIYPKEKKGYFYPASEQAAAVLDVLRMELKHQNIHIVTQCDVSSVRKTKKGFQIMSNKDVFYADACVFTCGLKAFPKSGSDGSALPYIENLGHTIIDIVPALVQLKAKPSYFKALAGIRAEIGVSLYIDNNLICSDVGEVQLTDYGISGIPTFQISRYASKALVQKKSVKVSMDLLPYLSKQDLREELYERFEKNSFMKTCEEALIGLFPKKMIPILLKECKISISKSAASLSSKMRDEFALKLKDFKIDIIGTKGFESAQVCAGGVDTAEVNPETMESYLVPGLFFAGEVLDIDGVCGGYNLQWAWSSGYTAGISCSKE